MKLFFDTEFTKLSKDAELISLGIVSEDGDVFYAEFSDYDKSKLDPWIIENVIKNLSYSPGDSDINVPDYFYYGSRKFIKAKLLDWLSKFNRIQFVSDVCHYDFVFLIDLLFGEALNMPSNFSPICHDINTDIAKYLEISERHAFNISRESLLENHNIFVSGKKHNALYDAHVIRELYKLTGGK